MLSFCVCLSFCLSAYASLFSLLNTSYPFKFLHHSLSLSLSLSPYHTPSLSFFEEFSIALTIFSFDILYFFLSIGPFPFPLAQTAPPPPSTQDRSTLQVKFFLHPLKILCHSPSRKFLHQNFFFRKKLNFLNEGESSNFSQIRGKNSSLENNRSC